MAKRSRGDRSFLNLLSLSVIFFSLVTLVGLAQNKTSFLSSAGRNANNQSVSGVALVNFDPSTFVSTFSAPNDEFEDGDPIEVRYYSRQQTNPRYEYIQASCPGGGDACNFQTQFNAASGESGFSVFRVGKTSSAIQFEIAGEVARNWMVAGWVKNEWMAFATLMPEYPINGQNIAVLPGQTSVRQVKVLAASPPIPVEQIDWQFSGPRGITYEMDFISESPTPYAQYTQIWELSITNKTFQTTGDASLKVVSGPAINEFPAAEFTISAY